MAPLYPWQYLYEQWTPIPEVSSFASPDCLTGKTVIVTGANVGLGLEAARHLARFSPQKLILACRDPQKGQQAAWDIRDDTGCRTVHSWELDLSSFGSVRNFAKRFEREGGGKLDILIENAAVSYPTYQTTEDGWESMLKVNHLGTAHLAFRLLPFLLAAGRSSLPMSGERKGGSPRLVVVSSEMHYWVYDRGAMMSERVLETLNSPERCKEWGVISMRYGATKLMNILLTHVLTSHLSHLSAPTTLTVNSVNPGFCHSSLTRHMTSLPLTVVKLVAARSTEVGSRTLVHAVVSPDIEGVEGKYLSGCRVREEGNFVGSEEGRRAGERIWDETLEVLFKADPELREVLKQCGMELA